VALIDKIEQFSAHEQLPDQPSEDATSVSQEPVALTNSKPSHTDIVEERIKQSQTPLEFDNFASETLTALSEVSAAPIARSKTPVVTVQKATPPLLSSPFEQHHVSDSTSSLFSTGANLEPTLSTAKQALPGKRPSYWFANHEANLDPASRITIGAFGIRGLIANLRSGTRQLNPY
jgi:hypothetical protein